LWNYLTIVQVSDTTGDAVTYQRPQLIVLFFVDKIQLSTIYNNSVFINSTLAG